MKPIRLLPVVVMAIAAVLVLKTIGLVTNGGYVLAGVTTARAAGEAGGHGAPAAAGGDATVTFPPEPTLTDTSPMLSDPAPVLGRTDAAGGHGAPAEEHGAPAEEHGAPAEPAGHGEAPPAGEHGDVAATGEVPAPAVAGEAGAVAEGDGTCPEDYAAVNVLAASEVEHAAPEAGVEPGLVGTPLDPDCKLQDAAPTQFDVDGNVIPLASGDGGSLTDRILLERLAARRGELQTYEEELALRASLVDAAEKRLEERTATLQALEAQIAALVDQRSAMEGEQFAGIVAMYEAMKPKDAAAIFDTLEMDVLLRVAKAISSRKMAPIMSAMSAQRAQELTVAMATIVTDPPEEMTQNDLAALPQIVGQ